MPFFKTSNKQKAISKKQISSTSIPSKSTSSSPENLQNSSSLLPTGEIIKLSREGGADFGFGNPQERIRYFIKLGLLPHAVRKLSANSQNPIGHLPYWTVEKLIRITTLTKNGLTFPQIAKKMNEEKAYPIKSKQIKISSDEISHVVVTVSPNREITEKKLEKKLKEHEAKIALIVDSKLNLQTGVNHLISSQAVDLPNFNRRKIIPALALIAILITIFTASGFLGYRAYKSNQLKGKQISSAIAESGQVLAASSASHKLYIDADSEFSGTTLFKDNITAPNIIYGLQAGTGIAVSTGQNPTVSLNTASIVPSINSATGPITLKGSGSTSITNSGGTITISSSSGIGSESDTLSDVTGRGSSTSTAVTFSGGATVGSSLNLSYSSAAGGIAYLDSSSNLKISAAGTASQCLLSGGSGTPTWGACSGGSSGVTSMDGLTGVLTINNSSGSGTAITIDNASTAAKGIASFNSSNFSTSAGAVSIKAGGITTTEILDGTIVNADISGTAAIAYSKLALTGSIVGGDLASNITISTTGNIVTTSSGGITSAGNLTASNGFTLTTGALNLTSTSGSFAVTLTGSNSATFSSSTAGSDSITIKPQSTVTTNAFTGTLTSADLTAAHTWTLPNEDGTICTTGSVCSGYQAAGTYVTSVSGTTNRISISGTATAPVVDISASYVGQGSITTTGVLTSGSIASGFGSIAIANTISTSNNISTTGTGTITSAGVLTAQTAASGLVLGTGVNATTLSSTATAARAISFPDAGGTICISGQTCATSGIVGYWQRTGTTVSPATNTDTVAVGTSNQLSIDSTGNLTTSGTINTNGGTIATTAATASLLNANATTINFGAGATTGLNIGNGSGTITNIGNAGGATAINLTTGTGSQTFTSSVASSTGTTSAFVFKDTSLTTGTGIYGQFTSSGSGAIGANLVSTSTLSGAGSSYSIYNQELSSTGLSGNNITNNFYGAYNATTKSGSDNYTTTGGTTNLYGNYGYVANTSTEGNTAVPGTRNSFAGLFNAASTIGTNYGVYANSAGSTGANYGIFVNSGYVNLLSSTGMSTSKGVFTDSNGNLTSTGTLAVSQGGTGLTTFGGANTILYTSSSNSLTSLVNGSTGQCLTATTGLAPSWGSCAGSGVIGGSGTSGQVAFFNGTSSITSETSGFGWSTSNKVLSITSAANQTTTAGVIGLTTTSAISGVIGLDNTFTSSLAGAGSQYGIYNQTASTTGVSGGAITTNLYGSFNAVTKSGADNFTSTLGVTNLYGDYGYVANTSTEGGTSATSRNSFAGLFNSASNIGTNYALYGNASGATTNYALYTAAGNIKHILGASDQFLIDASTTANTTSGAGGGAIYALVSSNTDSNSGINLNYTYNPSGATKTGYGYYTTLSNTSATGDTLYGNYLTLTDSVSNTSTQITRNNFGQFINLTKSTTGTLNQEIINNYGVYANLSSSGSVADITSIWSNIGGYLNVADTSQFTKKYTYGLVSTVSATGPTNSSSTSYGVYTTSTTAGTAWGVYANTTNNNGSPTYGVYSVATAASGSTANYALYGAATGGNTNGNYGLYTSTGNVYHNLAAAENMTINTTNNTTTAGVLRVLDTTATAGHPTFYISQTNTASATSSPVYGIQQAYTLGSSSGIGTQFIGNSTTISDTTAATIGNLTYGNYTSLTTSHGANLSGVFSTRGSYGNWTTISTTTDASNTETDTYGYYGNLSTASSNGTGTIENQYGVYITGTGDTTAAFNYNYGIYSNAASGKVNYGLTAIASGASATNYGVYAQASGGSTNYSLYTPSGQVGFAGSSNSDLVSITNTNFNNLVGTALFTVTATQAAGNGNTLQAPTVIKYTDTNNITRNGQLTYGLYGTINQSTALTTGGETTTNAYLNIQDTSTAIGNTNYGLINFVNSTTGQTSTSKTTLYYGQYNAVTKSGTDNFTTAGTENLYSAYNLASNSSTDAGAALGTRTTYGTISYGASTSTTADTVYGIYGVGSSNSAATTGTKNVYGIYGVGVEAAGNGSSANIYGGLFNASSSNCGSGTCTNYGVYSTASSGDTNYGVYSNSAAAQNFFAQTANATAISSASSLATGGVLTLQNTNAAGSSGTATLVASTLQTGSSSVSNYGIYNLFNSNSSFSTASTTSNDYGLYNLMASSTGITATSPVVNFYGQYNSIIKSGADNFTAGGSAENLYGIYSSVANTSTDAGAAGTRNSYGAYFSAGSNIGNNYTIETSTITAVASATNIQLDLGAMNGGGGTASNYGIRIGALSPTGTVTYGIYLGGTSNATTNYGIYSSAGNDFFNVAANEQFHVTTASNIGSGTFVSKIDNTANLSFSGGLVNVYGTSTDAGNGATQYGIYNVFSNPTAYVSIGLSGNYYGFYGNTTKTGADSASFANTINTYGIMQLANNTGAGNSGTRNTFAGFFSTTADTAGTSSAYGVYAAASGAANNYGISVGANTSTGTNNYGINIGAISGAGANNYGLNIGAVSGGGSKNYGLNIGNLTASGLNNYSIAFGSVLPAAGTVNAGIYGAGIAGGGGNANYGIFLAANNGAGTNNYGIHIGAVNSGGTNDYGLNIGNVGSGSGLTYGINMGTIGGATGTASFGINMGTNASTATNNYGINIGAISGAGTNNYGIYLGAVSAGTGTNYGIYESSTVAQNFFAETANATAISTPVNLATGGAFNIQNTNAAGTSGTGSLVVSTLNSGAQSVSNYGIYNLFNSTSSFSTASTTSNEYGLYNQLASSTGITATSPVVNFFGDYTNITKSGADNFTTAGTENLFGVNVYAANTSTEGNTAVTGTRNTYGIYTTATGATAGTTTAFGVYASASGATNNYAVDVGNGDVVASNTKDFTNDVTLTDGTGTCSANTNTTTRAVWVDTGGYAPLATDIFYNVTRNKHARLSGNSTTCTNATPTTYRIVSLTDTIASQAATDTGNVFTPVSNIGGPATINASSNAGFFFNNLAVIKGKFVNSDSISTSTAGFDLAEQYSVDDPSIEAGDVVSLNPQKEAFVTKSNGAYDPKQLGVVATAPGVILGDAEGNNIRKVSLTGRVPVKVNDENGPIHAGDLLTSSSTPGVAMKADPRFGTTLGTALADFAGPGQGKITVFVQNNARFNLQTAFQDMNLQAQSFSTLNGSSSIDAQGNITTSGNITANGAISAANGQFTVDQLGNVKANSLDANLLTARLLNVTGNATIGGKLTATSVQTASIQAPAGQDLNINLGDSIGTNKFNILDKLGKQLLSIDSKGNTTISASGAGLTIGNGYICVNSIGRCNVTSPQNGIIYANAFQTSSTADLAESFPSSDSSIEPADLVAVDPTNSQHLIKSEKAYQTTLLGIVSTAPGVTLNSEQVAGKPLALAGRVPAKVNTQNGPIKAGDFITSSDTPGVGMKATRPGRTIGIALESFTCEGQTPSEGQALTSAESQEKGLALSNKECKGTIIVFVEPNWYLGSSLASDGSVTQTATSQQPSNNSATQLAENILNPDGTLNSQFSAQILTADQVQKLVDSEVENKINNLIASGRLMPTSYQQSVSNLNAPIPTPAVLGSSTEASGEASASATNQATSSAQLAQQTNQTLADLNKLLSTSNLQLDTLIVNGASNLAQTQVAGTFSQDGTFVIDYGKQLNVLGSTLYLQNDPLSGNSQGAIVDIGNGKVTIDRLGNLTTLGTLIAKNIQTKEITIDTSDTNAQTVGSARIPAFQRQITIFTTAIKPDAKVLITPTGPTGGKALYVATKSDFEGFTVAIDGTSSTSAIQFDWLIVNSKQVSQAN